MSTRRAVCLLSGGLDSSTCLALARREGYECYALSFDYGQRHRVELEAAARVAAALGAREHRTAVIDLRAFGGSALTADIDVPKRRSAAEMGAGDSDYLRSGSQYDFSFLCAGLGGGVGGFRYFHRRECAGLFGVSGLQAGVYSRF